MKLILAALVAVLFVSFSTAQVVFPGVVPPSLGAIPFSPAALPPTTFGLGAFGPFGGFPFGGFPGAFGAFGFGRGFFPFFGGFNPNFRRILGKRSTDEVVARPTKAFCWFQDLNSTVKCTGSFETFECGVETRLSAIKGITMRLPTLGVVPETTTFKSTPTSVLRLYSRVIDANYTFVSPRDEKPVTLALYNTFEFTEPGFYVKDTACWNKFYGVVNTTVTWFSIWYTA